MDVKGIIFDYGGTIDSNGDHWSEVIWDGYQESRIPVNKEQFRNAYVYAERALARNHILSRNIILEICCGSRWSWNCGILPMKVI